MEIRASKENGVWILQLHGKLDSFTSKDFQERLLEGIADGQDKILIDAEFLEYVSSAGLRTFYLAAQRLQERHGKIVFCALQPQVRRVFDIVDMSSEFAILPTRVEAMKEF
ncbi:STAS domain-containing protein [candidate division KSB1 bacterium]|nr:STAS domain-containing protein [candidate division KSB1 bacterium]